MLKIFLIFLVFISTLFAASQEKLPTLNLNPLTPQEKWVIIDKGTERAFSGKYYNFSKDGNYLCKHCNAPLYKSSDKFKSTCGWPSFDDAIPGAIKRTLDADGYRVEISCANCGAHLGHVFTGEHLTRKNIRYCVNSTSLKFQAKENDTLKKAYYAGGCFWGVEYYLEKLKGVKNVDSGYMGGKMKTPSYKDVCYKNTGYLEVVEVLYDPKIISYEELTKTFFEIHDPTQTNGQGPDIGEQYKSVVFVSNKKERKIVKKLITQLQEKGLDIATKIRDKMPFYKAEKYHQNHYMIRGTQPYCHSYVKRF
jgi:peptide methionine sulfoxide reductase msrA/msrB